MSCATRLRRSERLSRSCDGLVDDLLDVSRITLDKLELRRQCVRLQDVVQSAVETARPVVEAAAHTLSVTLPPQPLWVDVDLTRIAQVVSNLLNNAAKYTPPGGRLSLEVRREFGQAVIGVRDSGIGIAHDLLPRVFDLFTQGDYASERAHGGLGVGLALARRLVALHGDSLEAHSKGPGCGSEFIVRLPMTAEADPVQSAAQATAPEVRGPPGGRVLVVDDNRDAAESLGLLLQLMGCIVRVAYAGAEALSIARSFEPDTAFLDIGMPRMDGYQLARRLREQHPRTVLVAVTGWGQAKDQQRARDAGFDHHLTKPAAPGDIERLLPADRAPGTLSDAPPAPGR